MFRYLIFTLSILIGPAFIGPVFAEPHQEVGMSGGWAIKVNPNNGNGCYMQKDFETGTLVQVGVVPNREGAFFAAYNPAWADIREGEVGTLLFDFHDARFQGEVVGSFVEGTPGGYAFFNNPEFVSEFGRRLAVNVTGDGGGSEVIDLSGSSKAIAAVKACQSNQ